MLRDDDAMSAEGRSFDFVLDCAAAQHDINVHLRLLKRDGTLVQLGAPPEPLPVQVFPIIFPRRTFTGSLIGGIAETHEMPDSCPRHVIVSDIEMIRIDQVNAAHERVIQGDAKYRFVFDMENPRRESGRG